MDRAAMVAGHLRWSGGEFRRGVLDCATFADRWAERLAGRRVAADLLGPMSTARALRTIRAGGGMIRTACERLEGAGWRRVPGWEPREAGDIAAFRDESALGGESLGIVAAGGSVWTLDEAGRVRRWLGSDLAEIMRWPGGATAASG